MGKTKAGQLIIIGGHEDKKGDRVILQAVADAAGKKGRVAVVTVATKLPEELADEYRAVFRELGVEQVDAVDIRTRDEAFDQERIDLIAQANVIFFTGGDQLRISSQIGDTPLFRCMRERFGQGASIVGTSAGAAAMPETMLIGGANDATATLSGLSMAPGLAFIQDVVIDSHFAERGRIGRLLAAVAQNPRNLGLGIDEDTAVIVRDGHLRVLGSGAVHVLDGSQISFSSLSEKRTEGVISIAGVQLHVLGSDATLDLSTREPNFLAVEQGLGAEQ